MSRGVNKAILVGFLGADPETRHMPNGNAVTNFRVATNESWKDRDTGEQKDRTEWHSIVVYQKLAEIVAEYARKGTQVYVEGKLRTRKWKDKEGNDRYTTEINADTVQMLGRRDSSGGSESRDGQNEGQRNSTRREAPPPQQQRQPAHQHHDDGGFDDDIPF